MNWYNLWILGEQNTYEPVRFEIFTAVTTKNAVFWEPCGVTSQVMAFFTYGPFEYGHLLFMTLEDLKMQLTEAFAEIDSRWQT
jgi:hypothetical protein